MEAFVKKITKENRKYVITRELQLSARGLKNKKMTVIVLYSSPLRQTQGTQRTQGQGQHRKGDARVSHTKSPATLFSLLRDLNLSLLSLALVS